MMYSKFYKGVSFIYLILIVISGIIIGNILGDIDFAWGSCFIVWLSGLFTFLLLFAIYAHLNNQETIIFYLKELQPETPKTIEYKKNQPSHKPDLSKIAKETSSDASWICANCGTKNSAESIRCKDCGVIPNISNYRRG